MQHSGRGMMTVHLVTCMQTGRQTASDSTWKRKEEYQPSQKDGAVCIAFSVGSLDDDDDVDLPLYHGNDTTHNIFRDSIYPTNATATTTLLRHFKERRAMAKERKRQESYG